MTLIFVCHAKVNSSHHLPAQPIIGPSRSAAAWKEPQHQNPRHLPAESDEKFCFKTESEKNLFKKKYYIEYKALLKQ